MKKNLTYVVTFISIYLCFSCTTYRFEFVPTSKESSMKLSYSLKPYLMENQLFLGFTKSFKQSKIKIYEGNRVVFDSIIQSDEKLITKAFKVNRDSVVTIYFLDIKKPLKITKEQMENYKFIYLEKKNKKVFVEFNNGTKNFDGVRNLD